MDHNVVRKVKVVKVTGSMPGRYVIVSEETGETVCDNGGLGFASERDACEAHNRYMSEIEDGGEDYNPVNPRNRHEAIRYIRDFPYLYDLIRDHYGPNPPELMEEEPDLDDFIGFISDDEICLKYGMYEVLDAWTIVKDLK